MPDPRGIRRLLEEHLAVLHHAAPRPRRRHQHQAVAIEADAANLIAAEPAAVGGGIDASDERGAVEGVIAAIGTVFPVLLVGGKLRPRVAQHRDHPPVGGKHHHAHGTGP